MEDHGYCLITGHKIGVTCAGPTTDSASLSEMKPNENIYQDGLEAAFLHGASPIDNDYGTMSSPHLHFQRWSWLLGYAEGLRMRIKKQQLEP